jgi:hypothetical protein
MFRTDILRINDVALGEDICDKGRTIGMIATGCEVAIDEDYHAVL